MVVRRRRHGHQAAPAAPMPHRVMLGIRAHQGGDLLAHEAIARSFQFIDWTTAKIDLGFVPCLVKLGRGGGQPAAFAQPCGP